MSTWSEAFGGFVAARGISQMDVVVELRARGVRVTQSQVHYWCRGSVPRLATREQIEKWSDGAVSAETAEIPTDEGSGPSLHDATGSRPTVKKVG